MQRLVFCTFWVGLLMMFSCNNKNVSHVSTEKRGATDSSVVQNLIAQSEKHFTTNQNITEIFDQKLIDAEKIAMQSNDAAALVQIYNLLGKRHRNRSTYLEALKYHQKSLDIAIENKLDLFFAECYNQMGVVYRRIDENSLALDMHLKAMGYAEANKDTFNISVSLNGIGNINLSLQRYQAAIEYFRRSMKLYDSKSNVLGQAINTNNIGEAYLMSGNIDSALVYFFESLHINITLNSKIGQSICYNSIGDAYVANKEPEKALGYLLQALEITREAGDLIYVATSLIRVGKTYLNLGNYKLALTYLNEGMVLSKSIGSRFMAEEASRSLAELYEKTGNYKQSLSYYKIRSAYKDTLMNEKNLYHIATLEAVFESEKQKSRIAELNKSSEIQQSKIARQNVLIASIMIGAVLVSLLLYLMSRQGQLRSKYRQLKHQQRLLRSQMNPHFIFNALSAIQVFILENDLERSSKFLSDFAKLMRQVLRNSNYELISLKEEIDTLNYYTELQNLRFAHPFIVNVVVDPSLDPTLIPIPPMITQPFVENAIEHGLRPLGGHGKIDIRFIRSNNQMIIEVEDDGIGIDAIKNTEKEHDSMALKIVKDRLEIIRKDTGKPTSLVIQNLKEINPSANGTLVKIIIPIIKQNAINTHVNEKT
jgi:tetratricopeptide (TPR) repeat protein